MTPPTQTEVEELARSRFPSRTSRMYEPAAISGRFEKFVELIPFHPCWEWAGAIDDRGYSSFRAFGRTERGHRISYWLHKGPIPDGLHIDHLCRNRSCVNPDHLEAVSPRTNALRGVGLSAMRARQTHCKRGHEFTTENTRIRRGHSRVCRTCSTNEYRQMIARQRAQQ